MKNINFLIIPLLFLNISCAGHFGGTGTEDPARLAEKVEPADRACAYFYFLWGKSAELDERYEEALEAYEKVLLCDGGTNEINRDLAVLLIKMGRKREAAGRLQDMLVREPDDMELRYLLVRLYTSMDDMEAAIAACRDILARNEDRQALLMLGSLYTKVKKYDEAQEILERLIRIDPDSYAGYYHLARLRRELQLSDLAAADYEKALAVNWSLALAFELADFYEKLPRVDKAVALYRRILEEDEGNELARTRLISVYLVSEQPEKALAELSELRKTVDDPRRVDITVGRILVDQEKYDEAINSLLTILEADPAYHTARFLLAIAYQRNGDPAAAVKELALIPVSAPEFEESVLTSVRILHDEKRAADAIDLLEKHIASADVAKLSFYVVLASLYQELEQIDQGRKTFEKALLQYPDAPDLYYEYGMFFERIAAHDEAVVRMQKVLDLDPDNASALNYIGYTWADKGINLEKALEYIEKAVMLKPEDGYIRDSLGWVYFKLGKIEQAVVELEKATGMAAGDPVILEHMGDVYLKASENQKALEAYRKSLELYEKIDQKDLIRGKIKLLLDEK